MRIIGDASKEIEKETVCKNCGSELGFLPIDVKHEKHRDYDGFVDTTDYIVCPKCRKRITV
jgi:DNA-directed RNA polymerase subunit RPC12/RpoP